MRFGVLIDEIRFGGVEKIAIEEVRTLSALGHDAVLLILRRNSLEGLQRCVERREKGLHFGFAPEAV